MFLQWYEYVCQHSCSFTSYICKWKEWAWYKDKFICFIIKILIFNKILDLSDRDGELSEDSERNNNQRENLFENISANIELRNNYGKTYFNETL